MRHVIAPITVEAPELARWINGHHAFFPLIQALVLTHSVLIQALLHGERERAAEGLWLSSLLLRSSAAAMRLAGDMAPAEYATVVRPTMPEGFSGLMSADHAVLLNMVRSLKRYAQQRPHTLYQPFLAYRLAVVETYGAHVHVCSQHVGGSASLRMEHLGGNTEATALEDLQDRCENFLLTAGLTNHPARKGG